MTAEEIRATAVERLAVAQFEMDESDYSSERLPHRAWDKVPEMVRQRYRADARRLLPALGDLLPSGEAWGVVAPGNAWLVDFRTRQEAQDEAHRWADGRVQHAWIHEPTEVTE